MTPVPLLTLAAAASLLAGHGCASRAGSDAAPGARYVFPERFEAQQVVRVSLADGEGRAREENFVALLRREGGDLSVVLMEPFFFSPIVEIAREGGTLRTRWHGGEPDVEGLAPRLMASLEELYLEARWKPGGGDGERRARGLFYEASLHGIAGEAGCRFPARLELRPSRGPARKVIVSTDTIRCGEAK